MSLKFQATEHRQREWETHITPKIDRGGGGGAVEVA